MRKPDPGKACEGGHTADQPAQALLRRLFDAAVASAQPDQCVPAALPPAPAGRTVVIGAGKAAAGMAQAVERHWNGALEGLVITRHGHALLCERITVCEAGHPVPDAAGVAATRDMLSLLDGLTERDLVLCLISGGGSALLAAPPPGIGLAELQATFRDLLRSGATVAQMNCIRKHLSLVAGGRLAERARPARLVTLAISDVPGDDPATIASGPTVADPTTRQDALATFDALNLTPARAVRHWLAQADSETPKPGALPPSDFRLVASPQMALDAAAAVAREAGYTPFILGSAIEGEAREAAIVHAGIAMQVRRYRQPAEPPCVLLSGGETSVTVRGNGRGGRNGEFLLALAQALRGEPAIHALAADTDGIDGTETNAGAVIGPETLAIAEAKGLPASQALEASDAYRFFEAADALVVTGPTHTNVNDFRAILIDAAADERK
ncbi:glycerate kinase type-2 family protein [Stakelama tenebrarum]|uniref:Glycerate kinase n=1 Tax=Stakelama tenebrarum TaxID=2711215 RepID=A0A6G6Y1J3_9SPHN|nr:glycerate kinase [Sphingosinithalassobacter tenebrarum]QIG78769.1 glycerate kinase [Sphingosinithalassobacter tenebrarum]